MEQLRFISFLKIPMMWMRCRLDLLFQVLAQQPTKLRNISLNSLLHWQNHSTQWRAAGNSSRDFGIDQLETTLK